MNRAFHIFKKDPFLTALGLLAVVCALWFCLEPGEFKAVWSKNPLVAEIIKEHHSAEQKSKFASIGVYYPYLPYFAGIVAGIEQPRKEWMDTYYSGKPYIFGLYYEKVVEMFPDDDAGHFLYGYCEYYSGNLDSARGQFEESIRLNPYFFWSYYNLGVIYFQQGNFLKSAEILSQGFIYKKILTLDILRQKAFYGQIWQLIADPPQILGRNLNEGKEDAEILLTAYLVKEGRSDEALQMIKYVEQGSFRRQELWGDLSKKATSKQRATGDIDRLIKEQIPVRLF